MGCLKDSLLVVSVMVSVLGLLAGDYIGLEFAGLSLVGLVALIAIGRAVRRKDNRKQARGDGCAFSTFGILLPLVATLTFVAVQGQGELGVLRPLGVLLIVLLGFYVMFRGVGGSFSGRR